MSSSVTSDIEIEIQATSSPSVSQSSSSSSSASSSSSTTPRLRKAVVIVDRQRSESDSDSDLRGDGGADGDGENFVVNPIHSRSATQITDDMFHEPNIENPLITNQEQEQGATSSTPPISSSSPLASSSFPDSSISPIPPISVYPDTHNAPVSPSSPASPRSPTNRLRRELTSFRNQLPSSLFKGMTNLVMPSYIFSAVSNITLPSRLAVLGRREFSILAAIWPSQFGNSVCGFAPALSTKHRIKMQMHLLPWTFSRAMARTWLFVLLFLTTAIVYFILFYFNYVEANFGSIWMLGTAAAFLVSVELATYRRAEDGSLVFLRSLGAPQMEEYMFSYSWKHKAEDIRTLARGMYQAGVGVWIDVIKLTPGDEIGPLLRTIVSRVYRLVIFISPAYCASPNCCIEMMEAIQNPKKCVFCIIKPVSKEIRTFLESLTEQGAVLCTGFSELLVQLDHELQDSSDLAFAWWKRQKIAGCGIPKYLAPTKWKIPRFATCATFMPFLGHGGLDCGPYYLKGDLSQAGCRIRHSGLLVLAIAALIINWGQIFYYKLLANSTISYSDYVFLILVGLCNFAPFLSWGALIDTRVEVHASLRPLLASSSLGSHIVKVRLHGDAVGNSALVELHKFLTLIGHIAGDELPSDRVVNVHVIHSIQERDRIFGPIAEKRQKAQEAQKTLRDTLTASHQGGMGDIKSELEADIDLDIGLGAANKGALFVWNGPTDPFTPDPIGREMMRYLVLVSAWEHSSLGDSLFSAIGIKVVQLLHTGNRARSRRARMKLKAMFAFIVRQVREKRVRDRKEMINRLSKIRTLDRADWLAINQNQNQPISEEQIRELEAMSSSSSSSKKKIDPRQLQIKNKEPNQTTIDIDDRNQ